MTIKVPMSEVVVSAVENLKIPSPDKQMAIATIRLTPDFSTSTSVPSPSFEINLGALKKQFGNAQSVRINNPLTCGISFFSGLSWEHVAAFSSRIFNLTSNLNNIFTIIVNLTEGLSVTEETALVIEFRNYPDFPYGSKIGGISRVINQDGDTVAPASLTILQGDQLSGYLPIKADLVIYIINSMYSYPGMPPPTVRRWECYVPFSSIVQGDNVTVSLTTSYFDPNSRLEQIKQVVQVTANEDLVPAHLDGVTVIPDTWFTRPNVIASNVPFNLCSALGFTGAWGYGLTMDIKSPDWTNIVINKFGFNIDIRNATSIGRTPL